MNRASLTTVCARMRERMHEAWDYDETVEGLYKETVWWELVSAIAAGEPDENVCCSQLGWLSYLHCREAGRIIDPKYHSREPLQTLEAVFRWLQIGPREAQSVDPFDRWIVDWDHIPAECAADGIYYLALFTKTHEKEHVCASMMSADLAFEQYGTGVAKAREWFLSTALDAALSRRDLTRKERFQWDRR